MEAVGAKVCEMPVNHSPRAWGESKYGLNRTFKVLLDLLVIRFLNQYSNRPIYLFGTVGAMSIGLSGLSGLFAVYRKFALSESLILTPLLNIALFSFFFGVLFVLLGLLAELLMRIYYESQAKPTYIVKRRVDKSGESHG
jgi:dolichol-phosphate mannosyltransferase